MSTTLIPTAVADLNVGDRVSIAHGPKCQIVAETGVIMLDGEPMYRIRLKNSPGSLIFRPDQGVYRIA